MLNITEAKEPCFAQLKMGCKILTTDCEGKAECPFYKPKGCEDWIRIEHNGQVWVVTPEEYYPDSRYYENM